MTVKHAVIFYVQISLDIIIDQGVELHIENQCRLVSRTRGIGQGCYCMKKTMLKRISLKSLIFTVEIIQVLSQSKL